MTLSYRTDIIMEKRSHFAISCHTDEMKSELPQFEQDKVLKIVHAGLTPPVKHIISRYENFTKI